MADQSVSELVSATQIQDTDLFLLEQGGDAKSLQGRVLLNWLTKAADGHGGVQSIAKVSTSGLVDTYRITLADTTAVDFTVTNGRGIQSIAKSGSSGLVDTYQVSYTDGSSSTFTVTNGAKGDKGDNAYTWIKYASQQPTEASHSMGDIPDSWMGVYTGTLAAAPEDWTQYKWYRIRGDQGDTGSPATLTGRSVTYMSSDSGTVVPSGSWSSDVPTVAQGRYLWTRVVLTFNSGSPITYYSVSRMGLDGSGAVSAVNSRSPDSNGNVKLTAADIPGDSGQSISAELADKLPASGGTMTGAIDMGGNALSGLPEPVAAEQAARKAYVDAAVQRAAPRNLLDNSDFTNPINQRGESSYTGSEYGIDRWRQWGAKHSVTISDGYIYISVGNIYQYINVYDADQIYTAAVCDTDGNIRILSGKFADAPTSDYLDMGVSTSGYAFISIRPGNWIWAALYKGAYTADTLPEYRPKGRAEELAECQRYYYKMPKCLLPGYITSNAYLYHSVTIRQIAQMRIKPTVKISGTMVARSVTGYSTADGFTTYAGGDVSNTKRIYVTDTNSVGIEFLTVASSVNNSPFVIAFNGPIELSADL